MDKNGYFMDNIDMTVDPPFQVRTAGLVDHAPYHSTPGTRMGDIMLTVFLGGRGFYRNSRSAVDIAAGMAGLVPPEDEGVLMAVPEDPYTHYYCRFGGEYARHMAAEIVRARAARFFPTGNAEAVAGCIQQMGAYGAVLLPERMGRREALLAMALTMLQQETAGGGDETSTPVLNPVNIDAYLRERMAGPTDIEAMARHFRISRGSLCRAVKRMTGRTCLQLHEGMKMEWAKVLLRMGTLNVTEVACRVGYDDPFYFSRVFKKHTGSSPKTWQTRENNCRAIS